MIQAVVGSGGKTTLIHRLAAEARARGQKVLVTTTTHMRIEPDTLLTGEAAPILRALEERGYAMAGVREGEKIRALPPEVYRAACAGADLVLVEADGSRGLPLKFPGEQEPVIPDNTDEILVVCGLGGLGNFVYRGTSSNNNTLILLGAIPAALLAIILGAVIDLLQKKVTPRGLRKEAGK